MSGGSYPSTRCAACRYLRRRCTEDCVLAPYFPANHHERFACVHRIFGAGNVSRTLQQLPEQQRAQAAESITYEAYLRVQYPVHGCVGIIHTLYQQIQICERELAETRAQIAMLTSQLPPHPSHQLIHQSQQQGVIDEQQYLMELGVNHGTSLQQGQVYDQPFLDMPSQFPDLL